MSEVDCDEVLKDLEAFLDGELPGQRAAVFQEHLVSCSPCLQRGDFRRRLHLIIAEKCRTSEELPPLLEERIRQAIFQHSSD